MSAQSRVSSGRQADRPSILEGESAGPGYGAADQEGGNRGAVLPNRVSARPHTGERSAVRTLESSHAEPTGPIVTTPGLDAFEGSSGQV